MIFTSFFGERKLKAALKKEVDNLRKMSRTVLVGYPENLGSRDDGTPAAMIAAVHEYGTNNVPARPTLRSGVNNAQDDIKEFIEDQAALVVSGDATPESVMDGVGGLAVSSVQQEIVDLKSPALKPSTIAARTLKSSNPLVDTGEMKGSVTFVVGTGKETEGI